MKFNINKIFYVIIFNLGNNDDVDDKFDADFSPLNSLNNKQKQNDCCISPIISRSRVFVSDKRNLSPAMYFQKDAKKLKKPLDVQNIVNDNEKLLNESIESIESDGKLEFDIKSITAFGLGNYTLDTILSIHKISDPATKAYEEAASLTFKNKWLYVFKMNDGKVSNFLINTYI